MFYPFTVDDAFIVARYAVNARDLGEWVFNAGEHVSAMTSPLHGLVLVGLSFIAADPIPIYKGLALLVVVAAFAACLARYGIVSQRRAAAGGGSGRASHRSLDICRPRDSAADGNRHDDGDDLLRRGSSNQRRDDNVRAPYVAPCTVLLGALAGAAILTRYDAVLFAGPVFLAA